MENNTTQKGGFYMLTEDISNETQNEKAPEKTTETEFRDTYDYYPDAGI